MPGLIADPAIDGRGAELREAASGVGGGKPAELAADVYHVGTPDPHRLPALGKVVDQLRQRLGDDIGGMIVREKLDSIQQGPPAECREGLREKFRADVQWEPGRRDVFARDGVAFLVGGGESLRRVSVHREATEDDLGFAPGVGQLAERLPLTMTAFVI